MFGVAGSVFFFEASCQGALAQSIGFSITSVLRVSGDSWTRFL